MVSVVQWHTRRVAASYLLLFYILRRRKNRKRWKNRKIWTKRYIARNPRLGAYNILVQELRAENPMAFKNFFRMNEIYFNEILEMIKPQIQKQDTNMRQSIPVGEKLALRYLATDEFFFHGLLSCIFVIEFTSNIMRSYMAKPVRYLAILCPVSYVYSLQ